MREDLLPEEIAVIDASERCNSCNHLDIFHHVDSDGYESSCEVKGCECYYSENGWTKEEKE
jgi:hypothetical protein